MRTTTVYLLHFDPGYRHARHYLGSTGRAGRIETHLAGNGSPLVRAAVRAGCAVTVARTWRGDRTTERQLKRQKNSPRLCPICNPTRKGR